MEKKIIGIIAEYNPFHCGHKWQITYAREQLQADYCIIALSGNFVQRGSPAILDKYSRAQAAVAEGADLVFEIPACFATGSLDDFSMGAVSLLDSLGVVTHLVFGSESGSIGPLSELSRAMLSDGNSFRLIRSAMKSGMSEELLQLTALSKIKDRQLLTDCINAITKPNNMLGILYLNAIKRLHSSITPITHKRIGQDYLESHWERNHLGESFMSATALREKISSNYKYLRWNGDAIRQYIPPASMRVLQEHFRNHRPLSEEDCWAPLCEVLSSNTNNLVDYRLVDPIIADRIHTGWKQCSSWSGLVANVSSKDYSPARISRCLLHIVLGVTERKMKSFFENEVCCYANLIASSTQGSDLLHYISRMGNIPIVRKESNLKLSPRGELQRSIDQVADHIYSQLLISTRE